MRQDKNIKLWRWLGTISAALILIGLSLNGAETTQPRPPDPNLIPVIVRAWGNPSAAVTELRQDGEWAYGALVNMREGAFVTGEGTQFVARWQDSAWEVAFEGSAALRALLPHVPTTLLPAARKTELDYASLDPIAPLRPRSQAPAQSDYKLPWPAGVTYFITRAWASGECNHGSHAVDVAMPIGSPIVAMRSGIVMVAQETSSDCGCTAGNAGNKLIIRHVPDDGLYDWYAHFGRYTMTVRAGDSVEQGQVLALSDQIGYTCGSSVCAPGTCHLGNCNPGAHLHFHVEDDYGQRVFVNFADVSEVRGCTWVTSGNEDQTLPQIRIVSGPATQGWYSTTQTLAWRIESIAGVWGFSAAWDAFPPGPPPAVLATEGQASFDGLEPGQHTLFVRAWDLAPTPHERLTEFGWFGFDPIAPTAPEISVSCEGQGRSAPDAGCRTPTFFWRSIEEHSGLSGPQAGYRMAWRPQGEPAQFGPWQNKQTLPITLSAPGLFQLDVQARDLAGNESPISGLTFRLGDYVWDDANANGLRETGEPGLAGVFVSLFANATCSGDPQAGAVTNDDGLFLFADLTPGDYCVQINDANFGPEGALVGFQASPQDQGDDETIDSDGDVVTHRASVTLLAGSGTPDLDFGFWRSACLGDFVFLDFNTNGMQDGCTDPNDPLSCLESAGVPNVPIYISNTDGLTLTLTTSANPPGLYRANDLPPGLYTVAAPEHPEGHLWLTTPAQRTIVLTSGACELGLDFGFVSPTGLALHDFQIVWQDHHPWLMWDTLHEDGISGFDLYRAADPDALRTRINAAPIPAHGPGQTYTFADANAWASDSAWYWLVIQPNQEWLGPWNAPLIVQRRGFLPLLAQR